MSVSNKDVVVIYFPDTWGHNFTPPYEMLFQYEALKLLPIKIILVDYRVDNLNEVIETNHERIFLVVISTIIKYTSITISKQYEDGLKVSEELYSKYKIPIAWTGLAATIMSKQLLSYPFVNFVLKGNGEDTLYHLVNFFINQTALNSISNLDYKADGVTKISKEFLLQNSFIKYGNFDISKLNISKFIHNNSFDYIATIGCVNQCGFCSVPAIFSQKWFNNK